VLEAFVTGLTQVFAWPALGFLMLGVALGLAIGALPGVGGLMGLVIALPFTYGMDPVSAFALLLALFAVTTTGDTITSVMLGIPGSGASATLLDGYPMAMQGEAARAFGAAFTVSAFGGVLSGVVMAATLPIILPVILYFGSPEFFMLGVLGLAMCGSLSGSSILKGLGGVAIGLLITQIGYAVAQAIPRFRFGADYLLDGLPLIPVAFGLFAVPELMDLAVKKTSISRLPAAQRSGGGRLRGMRDALVNWWLVLRCSALGIYIGMIPGLGGAVVEWLAYGHTVQSAADKSRFGQGDVRGVIGPEAASSATRGGALIPTLALGIPGTASAAILLDALLNHGLSPGRQLLVEHLDLTFSMVWTVIIANVLAAALLMLATRQFEKLAFLPGHYIVPGVILFVFMGAWQTSASLGDWMTLLGMGVVGIVMKHCGWPRPPVLLAVVLGPILESSLIVSLRGYGLGFLLRPAALVILALTVLTVYLSARGILRRKLSSDRAGPADERAGSPFICAVFSGICCVLCAGAVFASFDWPVSVRLFPQVVAIPAALVFLWILIRECRALALTCNGARLAAVIGEETRQMFSPEVLRFLAWLTGIIAASVLVGQRIALPLFVAGYLLWWGRVRWYVALAYGAAGWLMLHWFYGELLSVFWYPALLSA
jgi:TctA family transporter